jgi:hypothetical protein
MNVDNLVFALKEFFIYKTNIKSSIIIHQPILKL